MQVVFTLGGVRPAAVPAARPGAWLALVVSIGASVWVIVGDPSELWPVAALLGPAVVAAVMIQLARRGGRQALTASLTMTVAACALALLPVAWVALVGAEGGVHAVWLACWEWASSGWPSCCRLRWRSDGRWPCCSQAPLALVVFAAEGSPMLCLPSAEWSWQPLRR